MSNTKPRRPWPRVGGLMIRVRRPLYWLGLRPAPGSIWHSPSMALVFDFYDAQRGAYERAEGTRP